jgi:xanthine dehydrogenase accessory factor
MRTRLLFNFSRSWHAFLALAAMYHRGSAGCVARSFQYAGRGLPPLRHDDSLVCRSQTKNQESGIPSMRDVVRHLIDALEQDRELILCQVVETRGSTPQKAGALMIIDPDGGQVGTLGGGCVENEVKMKAIRQLGGSAAAVHSFVLDHDYAWADGLICGGKMVIVTQSVRGPEPLAYFRSLDQAIEQGQGFTEAVVVDQQQAGGSALGTRFLLGSEGQTQSSWPQDSLPNGLKSDLVPPIDRPKPLVRRGIAYLPQWPRIRLIIVGAGHVGHAVAGLAAQAEFDVWIIDDRHQYANRERYPGAQRVLVGTIDDMIKSLEITPRDFVLIVTRGHGHDQEALYHLAPTAASYVGLIGSRRKIRLIFENLREAGISDQHLERVTAPVGLEIGSQTVPEIAISIVAELIARRNLGPRGTAPRQNGERSDSAITGGAVGAGVASRT